MNTILAIDDQKDNLTTIKAVIKSHITNCRVLTAMSGKEGIELAKKEQPDAILLDIIMPEMDGYDTCKRLKENELTKHIPVVMVTAIKTDSESRVKGLNMGADAFLSKPIDPIELSAQVKVMLRIKEAEDKLRADKEILEDKVLERTHELKESEARLNSVFRAAPTGIGVTIDRRFEFVNKKLIDMLGYSEEELIGQSSRIIYQSDEEYERVWKYKYEQIQQFGTGIIETRFFSKGGRLIDVLLCSTPIDFDDLSKGVTFTATDITERKQMEHTLQVSEEKYKALYNNAPLSYQSLNENGCLLDVNPTWLTTLGYEKEEVIGKYFSEFLHQDWKPNFEKNFPVFKERGYINDAQFKIKHKDGHYLDISFEGCIGYDIDGKVKQTYCTFQDITGRKKAEQIQKVLFNISNAAITTDNLTKLIGQVQQELGSVIDTTNFYIALYDQKTDTLSLPFFADNNDNYTSIPAGRTFTKYVIKTKKSLLANKEKIKKLKKAGEVEIIGTNSKIWLGVPLKIEDRVTGVIAVQSYTDESAYNESDMELLEFVADQISVSLDRRKTEEDLIVALNKAQESDRLKSAFLANMSHEIRTPMNGILGFASLLKEHGLSSEKQQEYVGIIENSGNRMLNLINDLVDISKLEAGQMDIIISETNIIEQFENLYTFFKPEVEQKDMKFSYNIKLNKEEAIIQTDNEKLFAILTNLIKNAIKYSDKGSIEFGCTIVKEVTESVNLEFYVKDTGIGIPKDRQQAVFDRFVQADIEDLEVREGAGLGLAISKAYVEMMGGRMWLESEQGKGSHFYFTIPYTRKSTKIKKTIPSDSIQERTDNLKNLNILVAEDDEMANIFLTEILQDKCEKILYAKTGKETVELCKKNKDIDLILMDIKMSDMNGYDATRRIREFNTDVVIIAQTAYAIAGDREKAIEAGCNEYISKPIDTSELFRKICKLLGH